MKLLLQKVISYFKSRRKTRPQAPQPQSARSNSPTAIGTFNGVENVTVNGGIFVTIIGKSSSPQALALFVRVM